MTEAERFLSASLETSQDGIAYLVLEFTDGAWWMYSLDKHQKIIEAKLYPDQAAAFQYAELQFQVRSADWTKDRQH